MYVRDQQQSKWGGGKQNLSESLPVIKAQHKASSNPSWHTKPNAACETYSVLDWNDKPFLVPPGSVNRFRPSWEGCDSGWSGSLQLKEIMRELTTGGCLLTTLPAGGHQVLPGWRSGCHISVSIPVNVCFSNQVTKNNSCAME